MFFKKLSCDAIFYMCRSHLSVINNVRRLPCITLNHQIHLQQYLRGKLFLDHENQHAYNILMQNTPYLYRPQEVLDQKETINETSFKTLLNQDWSRKSPKDIFDVFPKLGIYCTKNNLSIADKIFDTYIDNLTDNLKFASDEELLFIFDSISKWPVTETILTRNFIEVWAALDDECFNRMKSWNIDEKLKFLSCFYMLNLTKSSDYSYKALEKLAYKAKTLTPKQLVQTLFFIGVYRKSPADMHSLELQLEQLFSEFTIDDLAIISMGFFKSKTPIRNIKIVRQICEVVMAESSRIHEVSLAALLKLIRYSMTISTDDTVFRLQDKLQHEVPRLSVMCNVHLALLGTTSLVLHKDCLTNIAQNIMGLMSDTRMKDLERLVFTFGSFNYIPNTSNCFFEKVIEELRKPEREIELQKFGRSYACCIAYLGLFDIYPVDLIQKIFKEEFLSLAYGKHFYNYGREILTLHNKAKIYGFETSITPLSPKVAKALAKKYTDYVPTEEYKKQHNVTESMFLDIVKLLKDSRGSNSVIGDHILTHHQRGDIIICNDKSGKPVNVTDKINNKHFGAVKFPPDAENDWIVLVIAGRNVIIYGTNNPTGQHASKLRELRKMGYKTDLLLWSEYHGLKTDKEKMDYINSKIESALNYKQP